MNITKKSFLLAADVIKKAKNILLVPHAKMDCDGMSSAIALHEILTKMGKNPTAVCPDPVPEAFKFLPSTDIFQTEISDSSLDNTLLLTIDTADKKFSDLKYEVEDGKVNILISSENTPFEEADFSFVKQSLHPDLIICLDSGDTAQLGKIYNDNTELFGSIPVLNIDHHISNTQFGTVNLVEMKNSSTTEIIYDLIPYIDERGHTLISEDTATLLLAGLITDTGSFQHSNTTPKSLDTAAELIELGARQQEIIKHLFKTKSLATLRLWGRILTQLKNDPMYRVVWSSVSKEDLQDTLSHSEDAEGLIDELLSTTPGTEMVFLVKEREDGLISTSIRTSSSLVDAALFADKFGGGGHRQAAGFKIRERGGKSFEEIVADIIFEAKSFQADRLGVAPPIGNITALASLTDAQPDVPEMKPEEMKPKTAPDEGDLFPALPEEGFSPKNISALKEQEQEELTQEEDTQISPEIFRENASEENVILQKEEESITPPVSDIPQEIFQENTENRENRENIEERDETPVVNSAPLEKTEIPEEKVVESFADMLDMNETPPPAPEPLSPVVEAPEENIETPEISAPLVTEISDLQKTSPEELPDFLRPENIQGTLHSNDQHVEISQQSQEEELNTSGNSSEDEFALFLANAQEKKEDDKFDTSFSVHAGASEIEPEHSFDEIFADQSSPASEELPVFNASAEISAPEPVEQEDDFLNFLNQEQEEKQEPTPSPLPNEAPAQAEEEFGDDFLAALKKENPELSPIETPTPEIFEIEKPSMPPKPEILSASVFDDQIAEQPVQHVQPENSVLNPTGENPLERA